MALSGFTAVLYYGIVASVTGGYLPFRIKNWWLVVFHFYLFLSFIIFPLIIYLVSMGVALSVTSPPTLTHTHTHTMACG